MLRLEKQKNNKGFTFNLNADYFFLSKIHTEDDGIVCYHVIIIVTGFEAISKLQHLFSLTCSLLSEQHTKKKWMLDRNKRKNHLWG